MKIGIISPSEIAYRRFMPALKEFGEIEYAGVAVASSEDWFGNNTEHSNFEPIREAEYIKALNFQKNYGGEIYEGYDKMLNDPEIEALYIPLPPGLHYKWAKKALVAGKHVFVEKPATCTLDDTLDLIQIAAERGLALHENYMFIYHKQIEEVDQIVKSGQLGSIKLYRLCFGFPMRTAGDFRYNKALGGGALYDAGGYTLRYARHILGSSAKILTAFLGKEADNEVDITGAAMMVNDEGTTVQLSFGMDNDYRCLIDIWGSKGSLLSERIFTAPAGYTPKCIINTNGNKTEINLSADDTFLKSIKIFYKCINNDADRLKEYEAIRTQAQLVDMFLQKVTK